MKLIDLTKVGGCNKRKAFDYRPTVPVSDFVRKSHSITSTAKKMIFGLSEADAKATLNKDFLDLNYPTEITRDYEEKKAWKLIERFVRSELSIPRKRFELGPMMIDIGLDEEVVFEPDMVYVDNTPFMDNDGSMYDGVITICKFHAGKAHGARDVDKDLRKYVMLKYGRALVSKGKQVLIEAKDIYFQRKDDAGPGSKAPNFCLDFYAPEGGNVVTKSETYVGGDTANVTDKSYQGVIDKFKDGFEEEECTEEDCKQCELREVCHYTEPPIRIIKEKKQKTIRDLELTTSQEEAIEFEKGIARINAGAGVGKTVVVALRTVTLLNKGVKPEEIVLMTFTNAGAEEMRERIQMYNDDIGTGEDISAMKICTFNSFGDDILKEEYARFGFTEAPSVIDEVERARIIGDLVKTTNIDGLNYEQFDINTQYVKGAVWMAAKVFEIVKRGPYTILDLDAVCREMSQEMRFFKNGKGRDAVAALIKLYDDYDAKLREENLIEFSDQEVMLFELLTSDPFYLEQFGYKHIIVDEFQDSNERQIELLRMLTVAPTFESLMVVGDDSQSIFGFRNTSPEFMINFANYIGDTVEDIYLLENHRCTPEIIEFANKMNEKNLNRVAKDLIATRPNGKPVVVRGFHDNESEQQYIIEGVKQHIADGAKLEDIAIICSTKAELSKFASLLTKEGIQSVSLNPEPYLENSRVKAALSFVTALNDETDTMDLMIYVNAKHGGCLIGKTRDEIEEFIKEAADDVAVINALPAHQKKDALMEIFHSIDLNDDEIYQKFLETLNRKSYDKIVEYCADFLIFGAKNEARREHDYPGVVLTTCHSSKGLEWPIVYASISHFDDEKFGFHKRGHILELEEKRRLLFVTATRARDELYVTSKYVAFGKKGEREYNIFLKDSYDCNGMVFNVSSIEEEAQALADKKKAQRAEERRMLAEKMKKLKEELAEKTQAPLIE